MTGLFNNFKVHESAFFAQAKRKATSYAVNVDKLNHLIDQASRKAESHKGGLIADALSLLLTFCRLLRAYARREYTKVPWQSLMVIIAALIYFVSPLDVVPDLILGLGLIDDAAILIWVMRLMQPDIDDFIVWENQRQNRKTETPVRPAPELHEPLSSV